MIEHVSYLKGHSSRKVKNPLNNLDLQAFKGFTSCLYYPVVCWYHLLIHFPTRWLHLSVSLVLPSPGPCFWPLACEKEKSLAFDLPPWTTQVCQLPLCCPPSVGFFWRTQLAAWAIMAAWVTTRPTGAESVATINISDECFIFWIGLGRW